MSMKTSKFLVAHSFCRSHGMGNLAPVSQLRLEALLERSSYLWKSPLLLPMLGMKVKKNITYKIYALCLVLACAWPHYTACICTVNVWSR